MIELRFAGGAVHDFATRASFGAVRGSGSGATGERALRYSTRPIPAWIALVCVASFCLACVPQGNIGDRVHRTNGLADFLPNSFREFRRLGIQQGGRIMPIVSYSTVLLRSVSGRGGGVGNLNAENFLFSLVFALESIEHYEFIRISPPALVTFLGLSNNAQNQSRFYSISRITPSIDRLVLLYNSLASQESINFGLNEDDRESFVEEAVRLYDNLRNLFLLSSALSIFSEAHSQEANSNVPLRIIPQQNNGRGLVSPGDARADTQSAQLLQEISRIISELSLILESNESMPQSDFSEAIINLDKRLAAVITDLRSLQDESAELSAVKLVLERIYRFIFPIIAPLLIIAGVLLAVSVHIQLVVKLPMQNALNINAHSESLANFIRSAFRNLGTVLFLGGTLLMTVAIIFRVIISARPPVTSLYSSLIFSSWALLIFTLRSKIQKWLYILIAGCILLILPLPLGDDLFLLQAILDSNFWLTAHVLVIVLGYVAVLISSILGHVQVVSLLRSPESPLAAQRYRAMIMGLRIAFLLVCAGTLTGGLWAAQSWGRFWGWDPKENAALMLILWVGLILCIRPAGRDREFGVSVLIAASVLVLLFSWFGVNLMQRGLHSYGWDSTTGTFLIVACITEIIFIIACTYAKYSFARTTHQHYEDST